MKPYQTKDEKSYTKFVVGGVYRQDRGDRTMYGTLVSSETRANGRRYGTLSIHGQIDVCLIEDTDVMNEWVLVAAPIAVELLETLELMAASRADPTPGPAEVDSVKLGLELLAKRKAG